MDSVLEGLRVLDLGSQVAGPFCARLLLGTHMHNALLHTLIQTGIIGAIPFLAAILLGWLLLLKVLRNLARLQVFDKHLVIQTGGILAFLTIRSITEATGGFFGVGWRLLARPLLYRQMLNYASSGVAKGVQYQRLHHRFSTANSRL